ncbi:hypothetical protein ACQPW3_29795 [Actinosynnema sp. CA-248983]
MTYAVVLGYAEAVGRAAPERAVELHNEIELRMVARRAPVDPVSTLRYERARQLERAGRHDLALREWEAITADEERMNGRLNAQTLRARREWLDCLADSGDVAVAFGTSIPLREKVLRELAAITA